MTTTQDTERAERMADAVWNDLLTYKRLKRTEDGYAFHYAGRDYHVARTSTGRPSEWTVALVCHTGEPPFQEGAAWMGRTREVAVKAMVASVYGHPCPHDYGTGRDSCPGCDHTEERHYAS